MAREGASLLLLDISDAALATAMKKVRERGSPAASARIESMVCDVANEAQVAAAVERVDAWGGVDVMFNNAGIMHADDADAVATPEAVWDLTHRINVKGVWYGCKHAVLSLRRHSKTRGSIINTASVVALVGSATAQLAYTASKGAVLALTRELAIVHAREGMHAAFPSTRLPIQSESFVWTQLTVSTFHLSRLPLQQPMSSATKVSHLLPLVLALSPLHTHTHTVTLETIFVRRKIMSYGGGWRLLCEREKERKELLTQHYAARQCCKTGSATTRPSGTGARCTFRVAASAKQLSRRMPSSFLPATRAASSTAWISLSTAA
jgi:NAD(P)-dependent dehydrogenase (short-subunit alcohol dehydrogenase family)